MEFQKISDFVNRFALGHLPDPLGSDDHPLPF